MMTVHVGIIVSISIITALSYAVLENPQVQAWLEQQRQKIAELLRSIGEELDPQSRRAAEAFAFEGRAPANDAGLKREVSGSQEAAALATGRSLSNASTIRRIPVRGPADPDEAEERRRKGREYLAKRNQEMHELKQRRKAAKAEGASTPPTPTSFDALVDDEGKLRLEESGRLLPSAPSVELVPDHVKAGMREVERNLEQPLLIGEASSSASAWQFGSQLANPFGDEYALDRSDTPKPPIPPKVALDNESDPPTPRLPGSFTPRIAEPHTPRSKDGREELSYEEQLAIALSLSEAEAESSSHAITRQRQSDHDEADLRAAIEASLKDMKLQATGASAGKAALPPQPSLETSQPLVDVSPNPSAPLYQPAPRGHWETMFDQDYSPNREPFSMAPTKAGTEEEDELYRVTPELTHARLATLNIHQSTPPSSTNLSIPYDPFRESASQSQEQQQALMEASFYSAASSAPSPATTHTVDHEQPPQLIDVSEDVQPEGARTPTSHASFGFQTDSESSDSETFASVSAPGSRAQFRPRSEVSDVEVIDVLEDSDVDMLSEEGDGIATPDSWTEVGSRDGDSEMEDEQPWQQRVAS